MDAANSRVPGFSIKFLKRCPLSLKKLVMLHRHLLRNRELLATRIGGGTAVSTGLSSNNVFRNLDAFSMGDISGSVTRFKKCFW